MRLNGKKYQFEFTSFSTEINYLIKKTPPERGFLLVLPMRYYLGCNVRCLEAFRTCFYFKGDRLAFIQGFEA